MRKWKLREVKPLVHNNKIQQLVSQPLNPGLSASCSPAGTESCPSSGKTQWASQTRYITHISPSLLAWLRKQRSQTAAPYLQEVARLPCRAHLASQCVVGTPLGLGSRPAWHPECCVIVKALKHEMGFCAEAWETRCMEFGLAISPRCCLFFEIK